MSALPSAVFGARHAATMWRLVLAVWVVSVAVWVPARLVLWMAVGSVFSALPDGDLPRGEIAVLFVELVRPVWLQLAVAVLSGWIALWGWTVLWHAGVVRWFVLSGRREVRLAEVLTRGVLDWWRWARLSLTAAAALLTVHLALAAGWLWIVGHARDSGDDSLTTVAAFAVLVGGAVWLVAVWLATLRGAWLLGAGDRRSAVLAWLAGLGGVIRRPVGPVATLAVWSMLLGAGAFAPLILGWQLDALRGPMAATVLGLTSGLLIAYGQVGLFLSFAPVTGASGGRG